MSDLHIDHNAFGLFEMEFFKQILQEQQITHLHIAGDISNQFEQVTRPFLDQIAAVVNVSFNLGNHDMLGMTEAHIQQLDGGLVELEKRTLVHLAGWYDYSFYPHKSSEEHLRDKQFLWFDRKLDRSKSDLALTQESLYCAETLLQKAKSEPLVALHFVPHADFIPEHPYFDRFRAFLGSQAFHHVFLEYGVKNVVFGHLHHRIDRIIDGIHYQARPLGYKREWQLVRDFYTAYPDYQINPSYKLAKRYRDIKDLPVFRQYYQDHLKEELQSAMTIFD